MEPPTGPTGFLGLGLGPWLRKRARPRLFFSLFLINGKFTKLPPEFQHITTCKVGDIGHFGLWGQYITRGCFLFFHSVLPAFTAI